MPENKRPYRKRDYAKELIQNGILNGFAAFYDNQIVGFCNSDIKDSYFRLSRENFPDSWKAGSTCKPWNNKDGQIIVCCTDGIRPVVFNVEAFGDDDNSIE